MATTTIRLKFTSLVKNRSKCCLEIVPEISSIQNIDKIKWTKDAESIEYSVPITYKIKLKKMNILREHHILIQNYYSCVDLVRSTSFAYLNKAAGDVFKSILSDHQIYSKSHFDSIITNAKISRPSNCANKDDSSKEKKHENLNTSLKSPSETFKIKRDLQNKSTCVNEDFQIKENTNRKNNYDHSSYKINKTVSTTTNPNLPLLENISNEIKSLSITPICKINTHEESTTLESYKNLNKSVACYKPNIQNKYKNHLNEIGVVVNPPDWNISFSPHFVRLPERTCNIPFINSYKTNVKSSPKVRVAHFKSAMEREILPLKIILHDLLTKCAALGFLKNKTNIQAIDYSKTNTYLDVPVIRNEGRKRCNRVVYSIVFEE
ncbi:uncharacterized protein LOC123693732 [Colias croceus]|uniref:uncharacterized protein LOC123693732 n=1 Tax=Colias crocea TaxID=72248 RepID=UPI001E27C9B8|nr:uncharacterized protein LOC123693732 [Colias croceus]